MKTDIKKRMISGGLVFIMGICMVFSAGSEEKIGEEKAEETGQLSEKEQNEDTAPAWKRYADDKITLDWYVNYSWFATPWGENAVSKKITEETGVDINFITPIGNETEKLNALIASETLPDLITLGYWEPQIEEMIQNGMVYALNELADMYDAYFWKVADEDVVHWYTKEDGNIYGYPCSSVTPKQMEEQDNITSNQTFLVRKDIYEAIGSPDMTTPEGFSSAVEKAAEMFPEVNGEPLIPVGAHVFNNEGNVSFDKYLMNFLAVPYEKDGKIYDRYTDDDYITWLKMFRKLGEKGLLANDIFVDTRTQMEEKLSQGRYFCMIYQYSDILAQQKTLYEADPESIYMAIEGPRNAQGDEPTLPTSNINGWTLTLISKNCKAPERAIAFMDYMISEHGQMRVYLGVEGVTYDMVDGKPVIKQKVKELLDTDRDTYDMLYGADDAYWMFQNNVMQMQWKQEESPATAQLVEWAGKYTVYNGQYDVDFSMSEETAAKNSRCVRLWSETLPKLLLAPDEETFDEIMQDFTEKRDALGFQEIMKEKTELMHAAKKKLGFE